MKVFKGGVLLPKNSSWFQDPNTKKVIKLIVGQFPLKTPKKQFKRLLVLRYTLGAIGSYKEVVRSISTLLLLLVHRTAGPHTPQCCFRTCRVRKDILASCNGN